MSHLALVRPSPSLRESYQGLVHEFTSLGEELVPFTLSFPSDDFPSFLQKLEDCSKGIGIPVGFVAHSTFWLIRNGNQVVGVSNIRHKLTNALLREGGNIGYGIRPSERRKGYAKAILQMSMIRAADLGLSRVLVTCAKSNVASARTILHNGGILDSEEFLQDQGEVEQRYWIAARADIGA
jgi:predicted acetyltransferase